MIIRLTLKPKIDPNIQFLITLITLLLGSLFIFTRIPHNKLSSILVLLKVNSFVAIHIINLRIIPKYQHNKIIIKPRLSKIKYRIR